eukprot:1017211-Pleurochrysis_carterae.AAC.1
MLFIVLCSPAGIDTCLLVSSQAAALCGEVLKKGLMTVPAGPSVLRMVPPLVVSEAEISEALSIVEVRDAHARIHANAHALLRVHTKCPLCGHLVCFQPRCLTVFAATLLSWLEGFCANPLLLCVAGGSSRAGGGLKVSRLHVANTPGELRTGR